ncbi:MAG: hypothetical protein LBI87_09410 [Candidatus Accumulibacter sp.]|nr:hypothetical protein [Accumulibacter sp.]
MFLIDGIDIANDSLLHMADASVKNSAKNVSMAGVCKVVQTYVDEETSVGISAAAAASSYFAKFKGEDVYFNDARITLIQAPKNGAYREDTYFPNKGFEGLDTVVFDVQKGGIKVQVKYFVFVSQLEGKSAAWAQCRDVAPPDSTGLWKISLLDNVSFADLPSASVAQTTGTGLTAQITLDTDAAGHSWFIDYTPYLNEEWLPTSNPYEWQAKPKANRKHNQGEKMPCC